MLNFRGRVIGISLSIVLAEVESGFPIMDHSGAGGRDKDPDAAHLPHRRKDTFYQSEMWEFSHSTHSEATNWSPTIAPDCFCHLSESDDDDTDRSKPDDKSQSIEAVETGEVDSVSRGDFAANISRLFDSTWKMDYNWILHKLKSDYDSAFTLVSDKLTIDEHYMKIVYSLYLSFLGMLFLFKKKKFVRFLISFIFFFLCIPPLTSYIQHIIGFEYPREILAVTNLINLIANSQKNFTDSFSISLILIPLLLLIVSALFNESTPDIQPLPQPPTPVNCLPVETIEEFKIPKRPYTRREKGTRLATSRSRRQSRESSHTPKKSTTAKSSVQESKNSNQLTLRRQVAYPTATRTRSSSKSQRQHKQKAPNVELSSKKKVLLQKTVEEVSAPLTLPPNNNKDDLKLQTVSLDQIESAKGVNDNTALNPLKPNAVINQIFIEKMNTSANGPISSAQSELILSHLEAKKTAEKDPHGEIAV